MHGYLEGIVILLIILFGFGSWGIPMSWDAEDQIEEQCFIQADYGGPPGAILSTDENLSYFDSIFDQDVNRNYPEYIAGADDNELPVFGILDLTVYDRSVTLNLYRFYRVQSDRMNSIFANPAPTFCMRC